MSDSVKPEVAGLVTTLRRNVDVATKNAEGITQADSLRNVAEDGSTLSWVIGHMVTSRDGMLKMLSSETVWDPDQDEKYKRGSTVPTGNDIDELSELLLGLKRSQALLEAALASASTAQLAEPSGRPNASKLDRIEFLTWHDTYHTGQTAVYRRLAGLAGTL